LDKPQYYKVLKDGQSHIGRMTWSVPVRGKPGDWHEIHGDLIQCRNGLHLTSDPLSRRKAAEQCYLAEYEGETLGPLNDELVCRKVRLLRRVPWSEFKFVDPEPDADPPEIVPDSPALVLLRHVWKNEGEGMGKSWSRLNGAMQSALSLAIECGMRFNLGDFAEFGPAFSASYWMGSDLGEGYYSRACGSSGYSGRSCSHGPNSSAYQSYEAWRKRTPFIVREKPHGDAAKVRLCVGESFIWPDKEDKPQTVWVTSFAADQTSLTACSYADRSKGKIKNRYTITHELIKQYHARIRAFEKQKSEPELVAAQ
jgi:hypothetical protein